MRRSFLGLALACGLLAAVPSDAGTVAPALERVLAATGPDDRVPVVVLMDEFPSMSDLLVEVRDLDREQRRDHVVATLRGLAQRSQGPVRVALEAVEGRFADVRVLWGVNGIALRATPEVVERLAALPGVRRVSHDPGIPFEAGADVDVGRWRAESHPRPGRSDGPFPVHEGGGDGPTGGDASGPNPGAEVAPEVVAMGAQQVWSELGYTGDGVIVAVIDDGVDRAHPDLADHIWTNLDEIAGNGIDDDGNGYVDDTWGWDFCRDSNDPSGGTHGTQVAGQVAGDGTNGTVTGMAPDAELMALAIGCGGPSTWWQASDYAIENGAHMITQSWTFKWPSSPDYEAFRRQTDVELAAGVIHVNSSGNTGQSTDPVPYNVATPGNCPSPWLHPDQTVAGGLSSIVGTANINFFSDGIDATSPYGPSAWEDIQANTEPTYPHVVPPEYRDYPYENGGALGLLKPDVAAYGDGTTSTCPGTGYCGFSGTSSATPHVAGVVALMLSSNLEASPEFLTEALLTTAEPRGVPGKDIRYGAGLVQAYEAVVAVESGIVYDHHEIDDAAGGNGDAFADPGERVTMPVTVRNTRADVTYSGVEAILSSSTPGVTIHNHHVTYPDLPPGQSASSVGPQFSWSVDPATCGSQIVFAFELRFDGKARRSAIYVRVGAESVGDLLADDFEASGAWVSDPGTGDDGDWVREDPIGVLDGAGQLANPEDDTTESPGTHAWVTGNGQQNGKNDENNNDVDGGSKILLSPPFGEPNILSLDLVYDRWYYDNSGGGDSFRSAVSNDGGVTWTEIEFLLNSSGGWGRKLVKLIGLIEPSEDMRIRFTVLDGAEDTAVEGAVDEVHVHGRWVSCNDFTPAAALPPNPVGDSLRVDADPSGHVALTWQVPAIDAGHDAATLFRILRAASPAGPFVEVGSATATRWVDVDALGETESCYYEIRAENSGGGE